MMRARASLAAAAVLSAAALSSTVVPAPAEASTAPKTGVLACRADGHYTRVVITYRRTSTDLDILRVTPGTHVKVDNNKALVFDPLDPWDWHWIGTSHPQSILRGEGYRVTMVLTHQIHWWNTPHSCRVTSGSVDRW